MQVDLSTTWHRTDIFIARRLASPVGLLLRVVNSELDLSKHWCGCRNWLVVLDCIAGGRGNRRSTLEIMLAIYNYSIRN